MSADKEPSATCAIALEREGDTVPTQKAPLKLPFGDPKGTTAPLGPLQNHALDFYIALCSTNCIFGAHSLTMEIQVKALTKGYGQRVLFSDVNFCIGDGERCALVGLNGSGKSTFLKILSGEESYDSGSIVIPQNCRIGSLAQHRIFTGATLVDEAVLGLPEELRDETYRVERLLSGLGFDKSAFSAPPGSFSSGFQLRLSLCKALAGEPHLLILDEPTNYLDILSIRWLEGFLKKWDGQIVFVSHDRSFVNAVCTHVLGIKHGQIRKNKGSLEDYGTFVTAQEQTHENRRINLEKKKAHMMAFVERFGAKASKAAQAQSRMKAVEKLETIEALSSENTLDFDFTYKTIPGRQMINAKSIDFAYHPETPLIQNLNLEVLSGERLAIIGKNGQGKSTLLRVLLGELRFQKGEIKKAPPVTIAYFGQSHIDQLDLSLTVEQTLVEAFPHVAYGRIRAVCGAMLFSGDDVKKRVQVLSGGERSRVLLAKIILTPANLLLLDEPTHHLDMESIEALMDAIKRFQGSVMLVSHDESVLKTFGAEKLIVCQKSSQSVFWGSYDAFVAKNGWQDNAEDPSGPSRSNSKDDRKGRAQQVQERSRALRPIREKLAANEEQITTLEDRIRAIEKILETPEILPHHELCTLSEEHKCSNDALNACYDVLAALAQEEADVLAQYVV